MSAPGLGGDVPWSKMLRIAQPRPATRRGRMSPQRARLDSSLRETSCRRGAEQAAERRKGNQAPWNSCPLLQGPVATSKIQAILFTCNSINTALPLKIWEGSFWWKASRLEFRIRISSVNKEMSKFYETWFRNLFEAFSVKRKVEGHTCLFFVVPAKSNNKWKKI